MPTPTVSLHNPTGGADGPALVAVEAPPLPPASAPPPPMPVTPDLATLQAVKEQLRQEHPDWYPDFRDSFGNQLTEKLLTPDLAQLSAAELGLPASVVSADPDRLRRELRPLAFAQSYLMAQAGDAEGLQQVSEGLAYFWNLSRCRHKFHYAEPRIMPSLLVGERPDELTGAAPPMSGSA